MTPQSANSPSSGGGLSEGFLIGLALFFSLIIVGGGLLLWRQNGDDGETLTAQANTSTTTSEEAEPPSEEAGTDPDEAEEPEPDEAPEEGTPDESPDEGSLAGIECPTGTDPVICDAVTFVEDAAGRPFQTFPPIDLADDAEFAERLLVDFESESAELEAYGDILRSLGLAPADADIVSQYRDLLEVGVVGFYDPEVGNLVVRGGNLNLYAQSVLVHELVHAHDDQWIGLDRPELDDFEDETAAGFLAIQEGNAERITQMWTDRLSATDRATMDAEAAALFDVEDIQTLLALPEFLISNLQWPYIDGLTFANRVFSEGGQDAIDETFNNPPRSSEQILHPEQFLAGEPVALTPLPDFDGDLIEDGVFGELGFRFWFDDSVAQGWGSDRFVTYRQPDGLVCTRIDLFADNEADLAEYAVVLTNWANEDPARSVDPFSGDGTDGLRITGCV